MTQPTSNTPQGDSKAEGANIPGFPSYKVFPNGDIVSYRRFRAGQLLKQAPNDKGQVYVVLYKENGDRTPARKASRVVATAFVPNPDNLPYVVHKNSNLSDNRAENLIWTDSKEAHYIPQRNGRYKQYKIDEAKGAEIVRLSKSGVGDSELARRFGVNRITIRWWRLGRTYKNQEGVKP